MPITYRALKDETRTSELVLRGILEALMTPQGCIPRVLQHAPLDDAGSACSREQWLRYLRIDINDYTLITDAAAATVRETFATPFEVGEDPVDRAADLWTRYMSHIAAAAPARMPSCDTPGTPCPQRAEYRFVFPPDTFTDRYRCGRHATLLRTALRTVCDEYEMQPLTSQAVS